MIFVIVAFIAFGLITDGTATIMKIRINEKLPQGERFSWWARNYSAVGQKYRELFPNSLLPDISRYSGWICVLLFVASIMASLFFFD
jgi:hypothetical protein